MPRGADRVGALVVADGVGEQHLAALRDLDMPLGDGQRQLIVVGDLVGLEDDRLLPVRSSPRAAEADVGGGRHGGEQQRQQRAGDEGHAPAQP